MAYTPVDNDIYLTHMAEFIRLLSEEGFSVGTKEVADCCEALQFVGLEDRSVAKAALRTICARSQAEIDRFDQLFDAFFVSSDQKLENLKRAMKEQQELAEKRRQAAEELAKDSKYIDSDDNTINIYANLPEEEKERLRRFMDKFRGHADRNPKLYEGFIRSVFMKSIMEQQLLMEDQELGVQAVDPEVGLMFRDISQISDHEMPRAISMIQKVTKQINGELSAKKSRRGNSGVLDFKRTIRKGLETGGSLIRLKYRHKRARKRHLVLLCDVSGSMIQFSEFALRFIKSLSDVAESSRTFIFSEDMVEVDPFALQNMDMFVQYVRTTGLYGKGTDLGSALAKLCALRPAALGASTTLLILSDAKTVKLEDAQAAMITANQMAGDVVWLNPIPQRKWKHLRSVQTMELLCRMVPCSTLSELARECRKLVLS